MAEFVVGEYLFFGGRPERIMEVTPCRVKLENGMSLTLQQAHYYPYSGAESDKKERPPAEQGNLLKL